MVVLSLTNACNFKCKTCIRMYKTAEFLSFDLVKKKFSQIIQDNNTISITGGEPHLHPEFDKFIDLITRHKLHFNLSTNGSNHLKYEHLLTNPYLKSIMVSLDGLQESHDKIREPGSFDKAITTIKHFKKKPLTIQMCVNKMNLKHIKGVHQLSSELGVHCKIENCIMTEHNQDIVLNKSERHHCRNLLSHMGYKPNISFWENKLFKYCTMWDCINPAITPRNDIVMCCDLIGFGVPCGKLGSSNMVEKCKGFGNQMKKLHLNYLRKNKTDLSMCDLCNSLAKTIT